MQVKQTQVVRLANIMGMDMDNKQHQVAMHDAITNVSIADDFILFCRNKQSGIDYANRLDKLEALFTQYKNTIDNIPILTLENFCRELTDKFKTSISILRDNEAYLTDHLDKLKVDSIQYFMNKEIELMDSVGGLNRLINLYELGTMYDSLYSASVKKVIAKNNNAQLTEQQKRVQKMIGGAL